MLCTATYGPGHVDERIETFLRGFAARLEALSVDELDSNRQALIAAKTQKDHTLADEADRNWEQISSKRFAPFCCLISNQQLPQPQKTDMCDGCPHADYL